MSHHWKSQKLHQLVQMKFIKWYQKRGNEMDDSQFKILINGIKRLENKLDILISLQRSSVKRPEVSGEEKTILKLCNGKYTIQEIARETNKTTNNVKVTLAHLKKKGLIKSTKINDKLVYVKI